MAKLAGTPRRSTGRRSALIGLAGAVLTGIGDVLILGRPSSGADFDQAAGVVPPHINPDNRWRSLWNGAVLSPRRIHVGTVSGLVGIGLLEWLSMRGISRAVHPGVHRRVAAGSATAFGLAGMITHLSCGMVISAYQRALATEVESAGEARPSPRSVTSLLGVSAVGSLGALAVFSVNQTVAALRRRSDVAIVPSIVTPLPCVIATLATFGALPAPVGGYARPASISTGLLVYFAVAASAEHRRSQRSSATSRPRVHGTTGQAPHGSGTCASGKRC